MHLCFLAEAVNSIKGVPYPRLQTTTRGVVKGAIVCRVHVLNVLEVVHNAHPSQGECVASMDPMLLSAYIMAYACRWLSCPYLRPEGTSA